MKSVMRITEGMMTVGSSDLFATLYGDINVFENSYFLNNKIEFLYFTNTSIVRYNFVTLTSTTEATFATLSGYTDSVFARIYKLNNDIYFARCGINNTTQTIQLLLLRRNSNGTWTQLYLILKNDSRFNGDVMLCTDFAVFIRKSSSTNNFVVMKYSDQSINESFEGGDPYFGKGFVSFDNFFLTKLNTTTGNLVILKIINNDVPWPVVTAITKIDPTSAISVTNLGRWLKPDVFFNYMFDVTVEYEDSLKSYYAFFVLDHPNFTLDVANPQTSVRTLVPRRAKLYGIENQKYWYVVDNQGVGYRLDSRSYKLDRFYNLNDALIAPITNISNSYPAPFCLVYGSYGGSTNWFRTFIAYSSLDTIVNPLLSITQYSAIDGYGELVIEGYSTFFKPGNLYAFVDDNSIIFFQAYLKSVEFVDGRYRYVFNDYLGQCNNSPGSGWRPLKKYQTLQTWVEYFTYDYAISTKASGLKAIFTNSTITTPPDSIHNISLNTLRNLFVQKFNKYPLLFPNNEWDLSGSNYNVKCFKYGSGFGNFINLPNSLVGFTYNFEIDPNTINKTCIPVAKYSIVCNDGVYEKVVSNVGVHIRLADPNFSIARLDAIVLSNVFEYFKFSINYKHDFYSSGVTDLQNTLPIPGEIVYVDFDHPDLVDLPILYGFKGYVYVESVTSDYLDDHYVLSLCSTALPTNFYENKEDEYTKERTLLTKVSENENRLQIVEQGCRFVPLTNSGWTLTANVSSGTTGNAVWNVFTGSSVSSSNISITTDNRSTHLIPSTAKAILAHLYCSSVSSVNRYNCSYFLKNNESDLTKSVFCFSFPTVDYNNYVHGIIPIDSNGQVKFVIERGVGTVYGAVKILGYFI